MKIILVKILLIILITLNNIFCSEVKEIHEQEQESQQEFVLVKPNDAEKAIKVPLEFEALSAPLRSGLITESNEIPLEYINTDQFKLFLSIAKYLLEAEKNRNNAKIVDEQFAKVLDALKNVHDKENLTNKLHTIATYLYVPILHDFIRRNILKLCLIDPVCINALINSLIKNISEKKSSEEKKISQEREQERDIFSENEATPQEKEISFDFLNFSIDAATITNDMKMLIKQMKRIKEINSMEISKEEFEKILKQVLPTKFFLPDAISATVEIPYNDSGKSYGKNVILRYTTGGGNITKTVKSRYPIDAVTLDRSGHDLIIGSHGYISIFRLDVDSSFLRAGEINIKSTALDIAGDIKDRESFVIKAIQFNPYSSKLAVIANQGSENERLSKLYILKKITDTEWDIKKINLPEEFEYCKINWSKEYELNIECYHLTGKHPVNKVIYEVLPYGFIGDLPESLSFNQLLLLLIIFELGQDVDGKLILNKYSQDIKKIINIYPEDIQEVIRSILENAKKVLILEYFLRHLHK